jgi:hypothetical protein
MTAGSDDTASESDRPPDASRRAFVRAVAKSIARSLLVVTVLVAVYYLVPVDASDTGAIVVRCIGAIVVIPAVVVWQLHAVNRSHRPQLRAVEGLAAAVTLMVVVFATAYVSMSSRDASTFSEPLGRTGALYFTLTTLTTVGFGDITARSDGARIAVMLQMVFNVVVVGVGVRLIVWTARRRAHATRDR